MISVFERCILHYYIMLPTLVWVLYLMITLPLFIISIIGLSLREKISDKLANIIVFTYFPLYMILMPFHMEYIYFGIKKYGEELFEKKFNEYYNN